MFELFGLFNSNTQLGVDVGNNIRVAKYNDNSFKTKEYQELSTEIKKDFNTKNVVMAINSNQIRVKFLDLPEGLAADEIKQMIELEFEASNLILQYEVIDFFAGQYIIALGVDKDII